MSYPDLTSSSTAQLDWALCCLLDGQCKPTEPSALQELIDAFDKVVEIFTVTFTPFQPSEDIQMDYFALRLMLGRFYRDAYGMADFDSFLKGLEQSKKACSETVLEISQRAHHLGLRISSKEPRKTRIASTFSLWMATLRPCSISYKRSLNPEAANHFCAQLNFWIATTWLSKFGTVSLGNNAEDDQLRQRILHDFTFRSVSHSSLEMLYRGLFQPLKSVAS